MQGVIEFVFHGKEITNKRGNRSGRGFHRMIHGNNIATGTKGLLTGTVYNDEQNIFLLCPYFQLVQHG